MANKNIRITADVDLGIMNIYEGIGTNEQLVKSVNLKEKFDTFKKMHEKAVGSINSFNNLNRSINRGDCIKDKTPSAVLDNFNLFFDVNNFGLNDLKTLVHKVIEKCKEDKIIEPQVFTRDKKGDDSVKARYAGLSFNVGFDSGLGLDNYLNDKSSKIVDTFGKYIDPSTARDASIEFPTKTKTLTIDESMFNLLGYDNCSINNATNYGRDKYDYSITLSNINITNEGKPRKQDENIKIYFPGNKEKAKINDPKEKKAAIIGKSLGDKMQVFIMFIKHILNNISKDVSQKNTIHCISTCDEIVMLFCILLELPCFYTSTDVEKKVKVNEVLYYNIDNINPTKARIRFEEEKKIVINGYESFIKLIREIKDFREDVTAPIMLSGDYKYYTFSKVFYIGLIEDLTSILDDVREITISQSEHDPLIINQKIEQIKKMTVNQFIKKNNGANETYVIGYKAKNYNKYYEKPVIGTPYAKVNLCHAIANAYPGVILSKLHSCDFSKIATTYGAVLLNQKKGGAKYNMHDYPIIENFFYTDPIMVYLKSDEYSVDKFDANQALFDYLLTIYNNKYASSDNNKYASSGFPFEDVYSEMLCIFNSDPNYEDEHLAEIMQTVIHDFKQGDKANKAYDKAKKAYDKALLNKSFSKNKKQTFSTKNRTAKKWDHILNKSKNRMNNTVNKSRASRQSIFESRRFDSTPSFVNPGVVS